MAWYSPMGYQMWTCDHCGCLAIAAALTACPMCEKEREMPKITAGGGPSNAQAQPPAPEPAPEPEKDAPAPVRRQAAKAKKAGSDG